jgi:ferritin-like metal-binding protein YciE
MTVTSRANEITIVERFQCRARIEKHYHETQDQSSLMECYLDWNESRLAF